jgi:hypothetical protein
MGQIALEGDATLKVDNPKGQPPFYLVVNTSGIHVEYDAHDAIYFNGRPELKEGNVPFKIHNEIIGPDYNSGIVGPDYYRGNKSAVEKMISLLEIAKT